MLLSMTAFARAETQAEWGAATWELRSVNHRYLDVSARLPDDLRALEPEVRERVRGRLRRGKVECTLRYQPGGVPGNGLTVDTELARQLVRATRAVKGLLDDPAPVSPLDVLRWPGVITSSALDLEALREPVIRLLDEALAELVENRAREGEKIAGLVLDRCRTMESRVEAVRSRMPEILQNTRERLLARLEEIREQLDPARLEQELALLAQKTDVAEELDRLEAHIGEMRRALEEDKPVGRRLDFLTQEMNREANTLGAKSIDGETTRACVDLKVLVEQIREQIQNVE